MDDSKTPDCDWKGFIARRWRVPLATVCAFSSGVFGSFSSSLFAQTKSVTYSVQVAVEPNLMRSHSSAPAKNGSARSGVASTDKPAASEPERIPEPNKGKDSSKSSDRTKRLTNFLPAQRPIGHVVIDVRSKPKGASNVVPENLAQNAMGDIPVVQAASAETMMGESQVEWNRNHDQVLSYQPLYFEEVNLERYGRTTGAIQPVLSGARFFATIPSLPYAMTVHQPNQLYTIKWPYDAGWGAPHVRELQPLQWKPGIVQAGAITGLLFVVP